VIKKIAQNVARTMNQNHILESQWLPKAAQMALFHPIWQPYPVPNAHENS